MRWADYTQFKSVKGDKMIIVEIQHSNNGSTAVLHDVKSDPNIAEQTYHTKLAYASVSDVNVHSVVMLNDYGDRVKGETYYHGFEEGDG